MGGCGAVRGNRYANWHLAPATMLIAVIALAIASFARSGHVPFRMIRMISLIRPVIPGKGLAFPGRERSHADAIFARPPCLSPNPKTFNPNLNPQA